MILHGVVSTNFDLDLVIPLIKDKTGNSNCLSNYCGITLIAVISKLFEGVLLDVCDSYLMSDDLQFGYKEGLGCNNAILSLRTAIEYYRERGKTVYASALDISKAFANVNHYKLYISLHKAGIPI